MMLFYGHFITKYGVDYMVDYTALKHRLLVGKVRGS